MNIRRIKQEDEYDEIEPGLWAESEELFDLEEDFSDLDEKTSSGTAFFEEEQSNLRTDKQEHSRRE